MTDLLLFQLRRVGRNRQYVFFTVVLPALFTVLFTQVFGEQAAAAGGRQDHAQLYMVSMMGYGAIGAALGATIRLAFDRSTGWLRQLRIIPVPPGTAITVDVLVGAVLVLPSLVVVALVGRFVNGVQLDPAGWLGLIAVMWAGSVVFVALGIGLGAALDSQAAGAAMGILGTALAALGGLWWPVDILPGALVTLAHAMPSYWYAQLGRDVVAGHAPSAQAVLVLLAFAAAFSAAALLVARRRPLYAVAG